MNEPILMSLSPALCGGGRQPHAAVALAAVNDRRDHVAPPDGHRLCRDHGTDGLDAIQARFQGLIDERVRDGGCCAADSLLTFLVGAR